MDFQPNNEVKLKLNLKFCLAKVHRTKGPIQDKIETSFYGKGFVFSLSQRKVQLFVG